MSGYLGTKAVTLSTTTANVGGDSTVGGDLTVDTNTLYVDSTNNRVGVGTASPSNPFQVGTSDLIVDSSGNVGIGTSSPSSYNANIDDLVVYNAASGGITIATGTTSQGAIAFADGTSASDEVMGRIRYSHDVNEMDFRVNNAEAMRIDSSGNVGIGTSSPASLVAGGSSPVLTIGGTDSGLTTGEKAGALSFITSDPSYTSTHADGVTGEIASIAETGVGGGYGLAFYTGVTTSSNRGERMRIDMVGNVGIGTDSPVRKLEIAGNNNAGAKANYIRITDTDTSATAGNQQGGIEFYTSDSGNENVTASIENLYAGSGGGSELTFNIAPSGSAGVSEAMRIDEDGNLLVGKTSLTLNTEGHALAPTFARFTRDGDAPVQFNRTTSSGDIALFYEDGATVGSIGTSGGNLIVQGNPLTGKTGIKFGGAEWIPQDTGANSDGGVDLGGSSYRFKDLYLSGGVYLGGTGSANKLDDYEEGTVTDAVKMGGVAPTGASYTASYTKVGNVVTYSIYAADATVVFGTDGELTIDLPFALKTGSSLYQATSLYLGSSSGVTYPTNYWWSINNGASVATLNTSTSYISAASLTAANCIQLYVRVAFTYLTT